jgi:hypothetical protein
MPCGTLSSGVGSSQYLAIDKFVDTNGTALTSHTPNLGPAWLADWGGNSSLSIQSNQAQKAASGFRSNALLLDRASDYSVSVDWIPTAAELSSSYEVYVSTRMDGSTGHGFEAVLQGDGTLTIFKFFASFAAVATTTIGSLQAGIRYTLKAQ